MQLKRIRIRRKTHSYPLSFVQSLQLPDFDGSTKRNVDRSVIRMRSNNSLRHSGIFTTLIFICRYLYVGFATKIRDFSFITNIQRWGNETFWTNKALGFNSQSFLNHRTRLRQQRISWQQWKTNGLVSFMTEKLDGYWINANVMQTYTSKQQAVTRLNSYQLKYLLCISAIYFNSIINLGNGHY